MLVVDDDAGIREALVAILEEEGYSVAAADDGEAALVAARDRAPAIILLDLMMPRMNGWEVVEALARDPALRAVPVCVLSAFADRAPAGVAAVLRKPIEIDGLIAVVARFCAAA